MHLQAVERPAPHRYRWLRKCHASHHRLSHGCPPSAAPCLVLAETRNGPDGMPKPGFRPALFVFCKEHALNPPLLQGDSWAKALPRGAVFRDKQRVRQIYGLGWNTGDEAPRVNYKWYVIEALAVVVHVTFVFLFPLCTFPFVIYSMISQDMCASSPVAPPTPHAHTLPRPYPTLPDLWPMATGGQLSSRRLAASAASSRCSGSISSRLSQTQTPSPSTWSSSSVSSSGSESPLPLFLSSSLPIFLSSARPPSPHLPW